MSRFFVYTIIIFFSIFPVVSSFAATSNFPVRSFIGTDTNPPTVPADVIATPVTVSQITVSWSASIDDFVLEGYHVWRDGVQIATTTSLVFSDTGLTASTTYAYYVTAYDSFLNESASSTVVSATTPNIIIVPPLATTTPSGTQTGTKLTPFDEIITSIEIFPQKDSVIIRYTTKTSIHATMKWGRTTSYEVGSLAERAFGTTHETQIEGLTPGTVYMFRIEGEDKVGRDGALYEGTFTTLPPLDIFPPGNAFNFSAEKRDDDVLFSWVNPKDSDFAKVRILENEQFYPNDVADGWVVYEGNGEEARSEGKALPGTVHYYTIFTYDELGNVSSGAVARLAIDETGVSTTTTPIDPTQNEIKLDFADVLFSQENVFLQNDMGSIIVDGSKQLTVAIPYENMPMHLKTIMVTLRTSEEPQKQFTFLLRANAEKTQYTATLAPLGVTGNFTIVISIFDFKTAQVGYAEGVLSSKVRSLHLDSEGQDFGSYILSLISRIGHAYMLWFLLLLIILAYVGKRLVHREL